MLISVIIPTFNRRGMIHEAIDSALAQTYPDKEVIVVDDGSTDGTRESVREFGDKIDYIYTQNCGVSNARNTGILRSKGKLIALLDSDDMWMPDKLEYQARYMAENPDVSICQTEEVWVKNGRRINPKNIHKKYSGWIFERCVPLCIVSPSAVMIRRTVFDDIGLFDEGMPACEDYDLWLRAALKYRMATLPEAKIIKRGGHGGQLSAQPGLDIWRIFALEKIFTSPLLSVAQRELVRQDIVRRAKIVADGAKKRGKEDIFNRYSELQMRYAIIPPFEKGGLGGIFKMHADTSEDLQ